MAWSMQLLSMVFVSPIVYLVPLLYPGLIIASLEQNYWIQYKYVKSCQPAVNVLY